MPRILQDIFFHAQMITCFVIAMTQLIEYLNVRAQRDKAAAASAP